jgi:hypothetical protein
MFPETGGTHASLEVHYFALTEGRLPPIRSIYLLTIWPTICDSNPGAHYFLTPSPGARNSDSDFIAAQTKVLDICSSAVIPARS